MTIEKFNKLIDKIAELEAVEKNKNEIIIRILNARDKESNKYFKIQGFLFDYITWSWWKRLFKGKKSIKKILKEIDEEYN